MEIKDAVARVTIVPEARADVKVVVVKANASLPLTVRVEGDKTIVDGDLDKPFGGGRIHSCKTVNGRVSVGVGGVGNVSWEEMPQVIIYTPMASKVATGGAVFGSVGRTDSLELSSAGCGDWMQQTTSLGAAAPARRGSTSPARATRRPRPFAATCR